MDKKIAGLLGAAAALSTLSGAQAAPATGNPSDTLTANSYAELLNPVPNAMAALIADDESRAQASENTDRVRVAEYYHHHHHHHHHHGRVIIIRRHPHHHHSHFRIYRRHHHHHHSHYMAVPRDDA